MAYVIGLAILICVATFFFPVLGLIVTTLKPKKFQIEKVAANLPRNYIFLIPCAPRDLLTLPKTIRTIDSALRKASALHNVTGQIKVYVDGAKEDTFPTLRTKVSTQFLHAEQPIGKWKGLCTLIESVENSVDKESIIVLCDASTCVPNNFLTEAEKAYSIPSILAFAPNYRPRRSSKLSELYWTLEATLKTIESWAGGSVSVHGALASYRSTQLKETFKYLSKYSSLWIHDDVVIPLTIRMLNPNMRIIYRSDIVAKDFDLTPARTDRTASRMAWGNWQWIRTLARDVCKSDVTLSILALRRVVRAALPVLAVILLVVVSPTLSLVGLFAASIFILCLMSISPSFRATLICFKDIVSGRDSGNVWN